MLRRTPLRQQGRKPRTPKGSFVPLCRRCHKTRPDVSFKPLRPKLCLSCEPIESTVRKVQTRSPSDNPKHLAYVRTQLCTCVGFGCSGSVQAHHVRTAATSGTGMKPSDIHCIPLCMSHHAELHVTGQRTFAAKYRVNLSAIAMSLAASANKRA